MKSAPQLIVHASAGHRLECLGDQMKEIVLTYPVMAAQKEL